MHCNINITGYQYSTLCIAEIDTFWNFQTVDSQYVFLFKSSIHFTGKELDSETGYSYFGARYYDAELSGLFFSVDPMADKYQNISPYAYCAWNPVKMVDPKGMDVWKVDKNGNVRNTGSDGGKKTQTILYANGVTATFKGEHYHSIMSDLTIIEKTKLTNGEQAFLSKSEASFDKKTAMGNLFLCMADNTDVEWEIQKYKGGKYVLSTLHLEGRSSSPQILGLEMSDLITTIHSHSNAEPNKRDEISSLGLFTTDGTLETLWRQEASSDYGVRAKYPNIINYYVYMRKSHTIYLMETHKWPLNKGKITKSSQLPW